MFNFLHTGAPSIQSQKETKAGRFLQLLNKETMNLWRIDKTKKFGRGEQSCEEAMGFVSTGSSTLSSLLEIRGPPASPHTWEVCLLLSEDRGLGVLRGLLGSQVPLIQSN